MATNNFYEIILALYMGLASLFSCNSNTTPSIDKIEQPTEIINEDLLGEWTYTLKICSIKSKVDNKFSLTIDEYALNLAGNRVECNGCSKEYKISGNKIVFPDKYSSATCTELKCPNDFWYCEENTTDLTHLFQDMNYKLEGDTLTLTRGNTSLTLTRVK